MSTRDSVGVNVIITCDVTLLTVKTVIKNIYYK